MVDQRCFSRCNLCRFVASSRVLVLFLVSEVFSHRLTLDL